MFTQGRGMFPWTCWSPGQAPRSFQGRQVPPRLPLSGLERLKTGVLFQGYGVPSLSREAARRRWHPGGQGNGLEGGLGCPPPRPPAGRANRFVTGSPRDAPCLMGAGVPSLRPTEMWPRWRRPWWHDQGACRKLAVTLAVPLWPPFPHLISCLLGNQP